MKFTNYFHYMKKRPDRSKIKDTIHNPVKTSNTVRWKNKKMVKN